MNVHRDLTRLPKFTNAVVTLGTFDGVHTGHRILVNTITEEAKRVGGESVLLTFDKHPRSVIRPGEAEPKLLTTLDEKVSLLENLGVDHLVIIPFTKAFSQLSAREYVSDFLVALFQPSVIVIGYNHRFGHHRDGNIELLQKLALEYQFEVKEINKQLVNDIAVSSSRIRIALEEGDVETASGLLGYPYVLNGIVESGDQRGRTIGFPTANIRPHDEQKLVPAFGVYAVKAVIDGTEHNAMLNIGTRPTVDGTRETIEAHLLDFSADLYGQSVGIQFHKRLRNEQKFSGIDALKSQLELDRKQTEQFFKS
ncbi:MAG TPA: bifunctional riboflavin kinase/FAD synthetase [Chitinophagales bacterium]|nr:bifunctional riboflavin kinase/FAD synthetase [Chitinophagales bacterium]